MINYTLFKEVSGIVAGIISLVAYIIYIVSIFKKDF